MSENNLLIRKRTEDALSDWHEKEKTALDLLGIVGELRFDKSIELVFFRQDIYDTRPSELLHIHEISKNYVKEPISIETSFAIAQAISFLENLPPAKIDIGKLAIQWGNEKGKHANVYDFVKDHITNVMVDVTQGNEGPKDVILYGFGRIGRLAARRIIELTGRGDQLRLRAIVIRQKMKTIGEELEKRAALLKSDSIHGDFKGMVEIDYEHSELIVNGNRIALIMAGNPTEVDYTKYGINNALVIDNTGVWRDKEALSVHLRPGVDQVMLTAPGKGIPNIVYGVNQESLDIDNDKIFCAASCTTNAIVPPLKVLDEAFGITKGHIETIHAYTNDQNLLDNFHKKPRRGRGAPINMVITSTGAAEAVGKVLPHLGPNMTGNAVRVPVPDGSLAILSLSLKKNVTKEEVNEVLKEATLQGELVEQIQFSTSDEYVSSNIVGTTAACIIDAPSTIVSNDGSSATVYAWYDNEYGYTCQVVRLAKYAARVRRIHYY
ncbi:MAG: glyceraldehyde-3-phosphate dehydrogenase [Saprospiraceae bacterium]|nr:glyceraldehyde-3-phosphate dehydrogenase [Saprospiraceae bacterium]